ncbi:hypothetical protein Tcan_09847 [Toxocara canis]|uniref:Uncharacterized protein n=1 Tax=Toxocara canis TaxID=6265 RepID=A0A0B2VH22_TOXCA|nr:hypothetical protein Tcan_09847 [Toxocara canis]
MAENQSNANDTEECGESETNADPTCRQFMKLHWADEQTAKTNARWQAAWYIDSIRSVWSDCAEIRTLWILNLEVQICHSRLSTSRAAMTAKQVIERCAGLFEGDLTFMSEMLATVDRIQADVRSTTFVETTLIDVQIKRPAVLCKINNVYVAPENAETSSSSSEYSLVEQVLLSGNLDELMQNVERFRRECLGKEADKFWCISCDRLLAMLAYSAATPLTHFLPLPLLPDEMKNYFEKRLGTASLPPVDSRTQVELCVEKMKFMFELISKSDVGFSNTDRKLLMFAIIKLAIDELCDCYLLAMASKALNSLFASLCEERRNAVFLEFASLFKFVHVPLDSVCLAVKVMTTCGGMATCKLLCLERLLNCMTARTLAKSTERIASFRAEHFKGVVYLLGICKHKSMHWQYRQIYMVVNVLNEAMDHDIVMSAEADDLSRLVSELNEWARLLVCRQTDNHSSGYLPPLDAKIVETELLSIVRRIEMWRAIRSGYW